MPELRAIVCWGMPAPAQLTRLGVSVKAPAGASTPLILMHVMLPVQLLNMRKGYLVVAPEQTPFPLSLQNHLLRPN